MHIYIDFDFLYSRYMQRRCIILENCPTLQYNAGVGVGDNGDCCDIRYLRSLLFDLMQEEVLSFCNPKEVAEKHQQVHFSAVSDA